MKLKFYPIFLVLGLFFFASSLFAQSNAIYVSGYVKNTSGVAIVNAPVTISSDSSLSGAIPCILSKTKYTNANGFYSDTFFCTNGGVVTLLKISTIDCTGLPTIQVKQPNANKRVEANFSICIANPFTCVAHFTSQVKGKSVQFLASTINTSADTLTQYYWNFGDGRTLVGKNKMPTHVYANNGIYYVCMAIKTPNNCTDTFCASVQIRDTVITPPPPTCQAFFSFNNSAALKVQFNGNQNSISAGDSIISRVWNFGDNSAPLTGNRIDPIKTYANAGAYTVCLTITTARGCTSKICLPVQVRDTVIVSPPPVCKANFTYIPQGTTVKFNSISSVVASSAALKDSIISRRWNFGDSNSTSILNGNSVDPVRQYARPGIYYVCLTITTARGCTSTYCMQVIATNVVSNCVPQYFVQRAVGSRTVQFNSSSSWVASNDTIRTRKWSFGDGSTLLGNVIDPIKTYAQKGIYTVCLTINTAKGCTNTYCNIVNIQDSLPNIPTTNNGIKIVSLSPVPARTTLNATIWSIADNVRADIGIYDIYGVKKYGTIKNLLKGNNVYNITVSTLLNGPYFLRVNTTLGNDSKPFYKL